MVLQYRDFEIEKRGIDKENRTAGLIFSTESPMPRWIGSEILLHGPKNVDLSRLKKMGAGLLNHNPDNIIGPLSRISISEFQGIATLGFDEDEIGEWAWIKVQSGSLRGVSVGYEIGEAVRIYEKEKYEARPGYFINGPAIIATRWTPAEVSLTPVPADMKSGVTRTLNLDGIRIFGISDIHEDEELKILKSKYRG